MNEYLYRFRCSECNAGFLFDPDEVDPTSSHGACKVCGSQNYAIDLTDVTHKDVFVSKMSGKSLKYNVIEWCVM